MKQNNTPDTANKFWKRLYEGLDKILLITFLLIFSVGIYSVVDLINVYHKSSTAPYLSYKPDQNQPERDKILGNVAWLTINDTNIDYPIMQGKNNEEYLNKDAFGQFSLSGSLFLDYRNNANFTDSYSLIYGHHMDHNVMFGSLDKFKDISYLTTHESGSLHFNNEFHTLHIFACFTGDAKDPVLFNPSASNADTVIHQLPKHAIVNSSIHPQGKKLIAMSTCQNDTSEKRTVVLAILED